MRWSNARSGAQSNARSGARRGACSRAIALTCACACALLALSGARDWQDERAQRLAALTPERPLEYLELAEEIADRAPSDARGDADRKLALELAAKAGALNVSQLGRSAALFIADVSRDNAQRMRMAALADALGGQVRAAVEPPDASAVLGLAQAFTAYKRGNAARARAALETRGTAALLDAHPEILAGGSTRFRTDCNAMRDGIAPVMNAAQNDALYALIAAGLAASPRTWSESISLHGTAAIPDFDMSNPAALFGVKP